MLPTVCFAAENGGTTISSGSYIQAGLALAVIVGILVGTAWLARKISGGKTFGQGGVKIIGGVALGPRERIVLLEVGQECLVIGVVPGQIRTLHRFEKPLQTDDKAITPQEKPFTQWLQTVTEQRKSD